MNKKPKDENMRAYVVRGKIAADVPNLNVKAGTEVWLGYTSEAGGWYEWGRTKSDVHVFSTHTSAKKASNSIGPWYNKPAPESIEILEADYEPPLDAKLTIHTLEDNTMIDKPTLYTLVRNNPKTPEGKYLVKRRDGTVVEWPNFVLGARDPAAPVALRAYANASESMNTCTPEMCEAIRGLALLFEKYREEHGTGDPGKGIHRKDDPATIAEMKKGYSA